MSLNIIEGSGFPHDPLLVYFSEVKKEPEIHLQVFIDSHTGQIVRH